MPSPRHTLASLIEKNLPLDKAHKIIGADKGFKSIVEILTETQPISVSNNVEEKQHIFKDLEEDYQFITISQDDTSDSQIAQENYVQLCEESKVVEVQINQDKPEKQEELVETPKERKQRLKKEKEEIKKS
jgi:hypothetical protein